MSPHALLPSTTLPTANKLLRLLPAKDLQRLLGVLERVELKPRQVLHHWHMPMEQVYFIEKGLVSVAARISREKFVEVWLVGSEGIVGMPAALGDDAPPHRRVVQVGGSALTISVKGFREILQELPSLRSVLALYTDVVLLQTSQSGACNAHHQLRQRLARWLLLACEGLNSPELPLTHDVLARLLGVRRASVSECLAAFETEGLVSNKRGMIRIEDPAKLDQVSCDCARIILREYQRRLLVRT